MMFVDLNKSLLDKMAKGMLLACLTYGLGGWLKVRTLRSKCSPLLSLKTCLQKEERCKATKGVVKLIKGVGETIKGGR